MKERILILKRIFVGLLLFVTLPIQLLVIGISFCAETILLPLLIVRWVKEGGDFYFGTGMILTWLQQVYIFTVEEDSGRFLPILYNFLCWFIVFIVFVMFKIMTI